MNYRHAFHAGNFADLVKHATLTLLLDRLRADAAPLTVVDTHAGAGGYDLDGEMSRRTGEAAQGIFRLMEAQGAPAEFDALKAAVRAGNPKGGVRFYPGSPSLIAGGLRRGDRYVACELRDDDHALLAQTLARHPGAKAVQDDGFGVAGREAGKGGRLFVLIDPPFERADDYERIAEAMGTVLGLDPDACVAVWLPLKDLETFDAFLRRVEPAAPELLIAEARLKPLSDPMKMNGCAMVIAGGPAGLEGPLEAICGWVAGRLGETGGRAEVWSTAS
ncbi:23S rRNA (adenine(2030)-N(6))-methyltransferase RlmJ [Caulobacter mirabilis]|uniref:Ribosomal RNA large subunit methyltransferase J n=1 Tax=Caulobacter mirabilis TaxID=69666 RepID=A0A2D2AZX1_9CAUL|nr:23S rRNA (adenine(2030)-N(6))-methyltransferase RlmJ [Caulobacter mirabilis]ATQ43560.1 23S rRNA (adenine(2030)-N(6))-methyltransferase RlmJ [Caulobacter mirabilis]